MAVTFLVYGSGYNLQLEMMIIAGNTQIRKISHRLEENKIKKYTDHNEPKTSQTYSTILAFTKIDEYSLPLQCLKIDFQTQISKPKLELARKTDSNTFSLNNKDSSVGYDRDRNNLIEDIKKGADVSRVLGPALKRIIIEIGGSEPKNVLLLEKRNYKKAMVQSRTPAGDTTVDWKIQKE